MEHSRQDAIDIMNAFHACSVLERDIIIAISSLNFYRNTTCKFLGEESVNYADSCREMLSELYQKVSSLCLIMTSRCADTIMEGKKDEGK
jgi:hypothetical protein